MRIVWSRNWRINAYRTGCFPEVVTPPSKVQYETHSLLLHICGRPGDLSYTRSAICLDVVFGYWPDASRFRMLLGCVATQFVGVVHISILNFRDVTYFCKIPTVGREAVFGVRLYTLPTIFGKVVSPKMAPPIPTPHSLMCSETAL